MKLLVRPYSFGIHIQYFFTGLQMLEGLGVNVVYDFSIAIKNKGRRLARYIEIEYLGKRLLFDVNDEERIDESLLYNCDIFFKRSYNESVVHQFKKINNYIYPAGLNIGIYPDKYYPELIKGLWKALPLKSAALNAFKYIPWSDFINYNFRPSYIPPIQGLSSKDFKIIFQVKAYDPYDLDGRSEEGIIDRIDLNEFRAECINELRKNLKGEHRVGFMPDPFSVKTYPGLVINQNYKQKEYFKLLADYSVGVANRGLYNSVGWKFGEYVSFGKAIVTERMDQIIPGLSEEKNYLSYSSSEELIENIIRLKESESLQNSMRINNYIYYQEYMRPDVMLLRHLKSVTEL